MLPIARKRDLVIQELDGEVLIYNLKENKAFCLNKTSALIWQACDGKKSVSEINDWLSQQLNSKINEDLIWFALDQLKKENLLENEAYVESKLAGMSRREVVKRIGLTSVVALPLVASLVAPLAVHAASACTGGTCTCNADSMGMTGQTCTPLLPCADSNCRCTWENNGNANGSCVA